MTLWKRQNYEDDEKIRSLREGREMNWQSRKDFEGGETILYDIRMLDTSHYMFVNNKNEP